ncbi:MAG: efflux RND transporter periplasmic adaptor subunit [Gemmataceae bacterium]|nr:efflux RND transporter periplasmic adaptor subunit [Gemmataceae bacterium]
MTESVHEPGAPRAAPDLTSGCPRVSSESAATTPRTPDGTGRGLKGGRWVHRVVLATALLVLLVGGLLLANLLTKTPDQQRAASARARADDVVTVQTVRAERVTLRRTTTQPATVHAFYEARVSARVAGYLEQLQADIGDRVEAGQVLGRIAVPELEKKRLRYQAEILRLQADEAQAAVDGETARAEVKVRGAQVGQAQAEVKKAEAHRAADQAELHRIEGAAKSGVVDQGVVIEVRRRSEASVAGKQAAEAAVESARAALALAEAKHQAAQAALKTSAARTEVVRKELDELSTLIDFATLRAPFSGMVTTRGVDPGDLVEASPKSSRSGILFTVAHIDKVRIRVAVPERDAPPVDVGDAAEFRPHSFPGTVLAGKVARLAGGLDTHTRTMLVEVDLPNPARRLLPGMFGQVTLILEDRPGRMVLPAGAVQYSRSGAGQVYLVDDRSTVRRIDVKTGLDDGQRIEILEGLTGQERVVAAPAGRITEGQMVRVSGD